MEAPRETLMFGGETTRALTESFGGDSQAFSKCSDYGALIPGLLKSRLYSKYSVSCMQIDSSIYSTPFPMNAKPFPPHLKKKKKASPH